jgi:hypothetical protein
VGLLQTNEVRTGDSSVVAPTVHFNTIVASGVGTSPANATSIGAQVASSALVPATVTGKGIWRSNIITAGPVTGGTSVEVVFREGDAKSDPQIFWNNLLHATLGSVLYVNESTTPVLTVAGVNALTDMSVQGNIAAPPLYVNAPVGNYHIVSPGSPARGAGSTTGMPAVDFDGDVRPNPAGNPDLGADEVP